MWGGARYAISWGRSACVPQGTTHSPLPPLRPCPEQQPPFTYSLTHGILGELFTNLGDKMKVTCQTIGSELAEIVGEIVLKCLDNL